VNYNYLGRYLLTATFRADGSSKFAPNNHWGYFPAAAAAWRISDEPFMESTRSWLDNLKLRLSYGTSGNDDIDASLWKEFWTPSTTFINGKRVITFSPGELLENPDLKWETTTSRNLGLDFSFWNGKLRGTIEAYWNSTKDILMKVPVAETTGHTHQFQNVGETSNKGIELSLFYEIIRSKDFNLSVNATYNYNKSNVEKIAEGVNADVQLTDWGSTMKLPKYDYILREGMPVGTIQGFKSNGFYTVDDFNVVDGVWTLKPGIADTKDIVNYSGKEPYHLPDGQTAFPGMVKFEDVNGDGVIDNGDMTLADLEAIKNHVKAKAYIFASGSCPGCKHKLIAKILEQCGCSSGECNEVISKVIAKKQEFHAAIGEAMKAFDPSIDSAINQFINRYGRGFDESYINDWKGVGSC
jgi:hypothetical protein